MMTCKIRIFLNKKKLIFKRQNFKNDTSQMLNLYNKINYNQSIGNSSSVADLAFSANSMNNNNNYNEYNYNTNNHIPLQNNNINNNFDFIKNPSNYSRHESQVKENSGNYQKKESYNYQDPSRVNNFWLQRFSQKPSYYEKINAEDELLLRDHVYHQRKKESKYHFLFPYF